MIHLLRNAGAEAPAAPSAGPPAVSQWVIVGGAALVVVLFFAMDTKKARK